MSDAFIAGALMQLVIILFSAKAAGIIFEKIGQSKVLGELLAGLILGPSLLGVIDSSNEIILFLAEIGVIVLLFEAGIESSLHDLLKSGKSAFLVACVGVAMPLMLAGGYILAFTNHGLNYAFFIGATLTATSVGLTVRVLAEINKTQSVEGKIILGAAVIDDIIGLILLSILADMTTVGRIIPFNIIKIIIMVMLFFGAVLLAGKLFEKSIISTVRSLNLSRSFIISALIFALAMSYVSLSIGLATIVGAFAAGIVLEREEDKEHMREKTHVLVQVFAPIFFVVAGAAVNLRSLFTVEILPLIAILTIIAIVGKVAAGIGVVGEKASRIAVGFGMLPRGEVGLIFASYGLKTALVTEDIYSALVAVIMITTFMAPPLIRRAMKDK